MQPVRAKPEADAVRLLFPADLTHDPAAAFAQRMSAALQQQAGPVIADASGLQHFDSSAIALLLECRRLAMETGRTFSVAGSPIKLQQLAQLYGVDDLFAGTPRT